MTLSPRSENEAAFRVRPSGRRLAETVCGRLAWHSAELGKFAEFRRKIFEATIR